MDDYMKIVNFEYCGKCIHKEMEEFEDPCHDCLHEPVNYASQKPVYFEDSSFYPRGIGVNTGTGTGSGAAASGNRYPYYDGTYRVKPKFEEQTLKTAKKSMKKNVTVEEIPVRSVGNNEGGKTVIIG